MEVVWEQVKSSQDLIKRLLLSIEEATQTMNESFEQTILKHEEQFIRTYKIKIIQLVKLFDQLKKIIEDKFINSAVTAQLENIAKERDYFKYQCLRINSQFTNLSTDYKNIILQAANTTEQMQIYKHLLSTEKIKSNQIEVNATKLRQNITELTYENLNCDMLPFRQENKADNNNEKLGLKLKKQIKEKAQMIRMLKEKVNEYETHTSINHQDKLQKKQLYELFQICVEGWKRSIPFKIKKDQGIFGSIHLNTQQLTLIDKKQLLKTLFTHPQFLKFIEKLLFDDNFKVHFENSNEEKYIEKNRAKLFELMTKRKITTANNKSRMI